MESETTTTATTATTDSGSTWNFSSLSSSANYPRNSNSEPDTTPTIGNQRIPKAFFKKRSKYLARHRLYQTSRLGSSHSTWLNSRRICRDDHSWFTPEMKHIIIGGGGGDGNTGSSSSVLHRGHHLCSVFNRSPPMADKQERVFRYVAILRVLKDEEAYYGDDEG